MGYNITSGRVNTGASSVTDAVLTSVRVTDIILDENHPRWKSLGSWDSLGTIFYVGINETVSSKKKDFNNIAKPLYPNIKNYPLKNEIVVILKAPNKNIYGLNQGTDTYYLPSINIWSHQHHNALPNKKDLEDPNTQQDYKNTENGIVRRAGDGDSEIDLGNYFKEQLNVKPLLPYEGDYIIEGRYGNSIRFGASVKDDVIPENNKNDWSQGDEEIGTPITIIRNGQSEELDTKGWVPTIEDINRDDSSIYMTSNQRISSLIVASTNFESYNSEINPPTDPLVQLTDPPIKEIKQPEPPTQATEQEINEESTQQDNDDTPPTPPVEEPTTEEPVIEEGDSLSFFDEMIESGQASEDDFVEHNIIHENTTIGGTEEDPEVEDPGYTANELAADPTLGTVTDEEIEKHETENKEIKEGKKSKTYPYTLTNKNGKEIKLKAPQSWSQLSNSLGPKSSRIAKLFIHTTAGNINDSAIDVMNYFFHGRKWGTGGYHFLIEKSGKVTQIYEDSQITNGVKGQNSNSVHFSWIGGYDFKQGKNQMTKGQAITLVDMVKFYCKRYPNIEVFGHNQVAQKACPWFFVPKFMTELGLEKNRGLVNPQWKLNMNALPEYQKVAQQIATGEYPFKNLA